MKAFLVLMFVAISAWADPSKCSLEKSQSDKKECMAFERDKAIGNLVKEITEKCMDDLNLPGGQEDSVDPLMLDECMADEMNDLAEKVKN